MIDVKYIEERGDYTFYFDSENMGTKRYTNFKCKCGETGKIRNDNIKQVYLCRHSRQYLGLQIGRWNVIGTDKRNDRCSLLICQCSCEKKTIRKIPMSSLLHGKTQSCGCAHYENMQRRNEYIERDGFCEIVIGDSCVLIDKDDLEKVKDFCWCINGTKYVIAWSPKAKRMISLARTIMNEYRTDVIIDHINGDTLDNRENNLRRVSTQENNMNQRLSKNNTSGHKGVHWHKNMGKWISNIGLNGKLLHIGYFDNYEDAVAAREDKERRLYGEYSRELSINRNARR